MIMRANIVVISRCRSFDFGDTGSQVCRLSHHSQSTLLQIEEPYLEAVGATNYELGACYNVTVECRVSALFKMLNALLSSATDVAIVDALSSYRNDCHQQLQKG